MAEEVQPCTRPTKMVGWKYPENLQPHDVTLHKQDENKAAHNGLMGKDERHLRWDSAPQNNQRHQSQEGQWR